MINNIAFKLFILTTYFVLLFALILNMEKQANKQIAVNVIEALQQMKRTRDSSVFFPIGSVRTKACFLTF